MYKNDWNMITEDYVSFETAKFLKEKGFDEKCRAFYTFWFDEVEGPKEDEAENWNIESKYFSAPTLQMAMKWLRKVHNIDVWVERHNSRYKGCIHSEQRGDEALFYEDSPEEAYEAAIRYCLENLI